MTKNIIHWWLTPKFPQTHIGKIVSYKPQGLVNQIRNFYRTWFVHPLKRRIAKYYLYLLRTFSGLKVIGITGSAGKTTTKEMLSSILKLKGETVYSFANIDPVYNIPTTILRCTLKTKFLVLEMGVEYPNEMDFYLWLARPDVGIVTNIYPTHILFFKNIEGVFREKSKLVRSLSPDDYAILNFQDRLLVHLKDVLKANISWFGGDSEISASNILITKDCNTRFMLNINASKIEINLSVLGEQFVNDALAAVAGAVELGIENKFIKKGLESFRMPDHRMNVKKLKSEAILIDDSYNNNPVAAKKAIKLLKDLAGKRKTVLVFGDMLELGKREVEYHKKIGEYIKTVGIDDVVGIGTLSKYVSKVSADDWEKALPLVQQKIKNNSVVLVKGSRSMNLDKLVGAIK